ncbi:helix-turn-helix domain-containing protein [Dactylosporangium sp. CS-033363]|uniref:helix-turn-helix domain-containing protein n=1 Tax=Dactylosporangium sp. CS-033363 TaxID=3239935 RepID=UPI003D90805B
MEIDVTPPFAELVRDLRRSARMTLRELATASGVSVRTLSNMERGQSAAPHRHTLDALADALALAPADRAALTGAARDAPPAPDGVGVPPRDVPDFTGRSAQLATLRRCFGRGAAPLTVVHGPPGVGKTALAVHAAARAGADFPGGVCFVDCRDAGPADIHRRLLRASGGRGDAARLVVLDGVTVDQQVAPLLPPAAGTATLVTSRGPLAGLAGAVRMALQPLTGHESVSLLAAITGAPIDPPAWAVARYCGYLPLALRIAGNRLAGRPGWTMAHLADRLADERRRLSALTAGDLSVTAALSASWTGLSAPARALARRLALTGSPDFAAARAGTGLDELIAAGLVSAADRPGRYWMHDLVRIFARSDAWDPAA